MKEKENPSIVKNLFLIFGFLVITSVVHGQDTKKASSSLPDNINKIVTGSCMPCHSSKGGMMPKAKLNFNEWSGYSAEKQKEKAMEIYKEISKNKMPPKNARETRPEIIPTGEQIDIIKKWADSF